MIMINTETYIVNAIIMLSFISYALFEIDYLSMLSICKWDYRESHIGQCVLQQLTATVEILSATELFQ